MLTCLSVHAIERHAIAVHQYDSSPYYLRGRIPPDDKRYETMRLALDIMEQRQVKTIVETGTARGGTMGFTGDGSFTIIFGDWAKDHQSNLFSVDINPQAILNAKSAVGLNDHVAFTCQNSLDFLQSFNQPIDFLYLDSFDFDFNDPAPSQEHHLQEIITAYPRLTSNSVVMIDDCDLPYGGKGALVIPYLLNNGWKILAQQYQTILVKE